MQQQHQKGVGGIKSPFSACAATTTSTIDPMVQQQQAQLRFGGDQSQHHQMGAAGLAGGAAEAASPISSLPPAVAHLSTTSGTGTAAAGNFEQLLIMPAVTSVDEDLFGGGGEEADRGGNGGSGGNRWPRQETLALLKIRSEMDVTFRDATLKGPLWDDVSRKLGELGYKRSAKKCQEKFENVHKYYKRTKEGRAGRQDGKSYRFFTQLEALHGTPTSTPSTSSHPTTTAVTIDPTSLQVVSPVPVSVGFGLANQFNISPISSVVGSIPILPQSQAQSPPAVGALIPSYSSAPAALVSAPEPPPFLSAGTIGVSLESESTSTSSYSSGSEEVEDDDAMELEGNLDERKPAGHDAAECHQRKRKRASSSKHQPHPRSSSISSRERMMEFFEGLMKQVMQKQEAMQQRFLEAIEKREQDRMIREEAWKRQEMARLAREHELLSQERAVSASRDAAIVAFLQKITGQTIQLPPAATIPAAPPPPPPPAAVAVHRPPSSPPQPPPSSQQLQQPQQPQLPEKNCFPQMQHHPWRTQQLEQLSHQPPRKNPQSANNQPFVPISSSSEIVIAVPNQQVPPAEEINSTNVAGNFEATSSRWPKAEVLALIKLRSGLESRYQEVGPKGPLWEEISAGMHQMGYKRSSKRCKEKWENINKYFKKVKESNKKRPEDAKTCPYFHELDALYQKKILGTGATTTIAVNQIMGADDQIQQQQQVKDISMSMDPKIQEQSHVPVAMPSLQTKIAAQSEIKDGSTSDLQIRNGGLTASLFGEGSDDTGAGGGAKKPEGIVKEQQPQNHHRQLMMNDYGDTEEPDSDTLEQEEDEYNDDDEDLDDDESGEETKMAYTIQFQRPNTSSTNGGGSGAPSFLAMVQ